MNMETVKLQEVIICEQTERLLKGVATPDKKLFNNVKTLCRGVVELIPYAKASNCHENNAKVNGFWSFIKIVVKFFELLQRKSTKIGKHYANFVKISWLLTMYLQEIQSLIEKLEEVKEQQGKCDFDYLSPLTDPSYRDVFVECTSEAGKRFKSNKEALDSLTALYGRFSAFWYDKDTASIIKLLHFGIACFGSNAFKSIQATWDQEVRGEIVSNCLMSSSYDYPLGLYRVVSVHSKNFINAFHYTKGIDRRTIRVRPQNTYRIEKDGIVTLPPDVCIKSKQKKIRCRVIQGSNVEEKETVIFHCHAGGFIMGSPEMDERFYLRRWCKELSGACIVSVNYRLYTQYPGPLQDVLDVYLWLLRDSPAVKQKLGFSPKKIVVCGESAGGGLVASLTLVLNELKSKFEPDLRMPSGVVLMYPFLNQSLVLSPSRFIACMDTITFTSTAMYMHNSHAGTMEDPIKGTSEKQTSFFGGFCRQISRTVTGTSNKPWYLESDDDYDRMHNYVSAVLSSPFASPLFSPKINTITIPLYLVTTEFCPLLDDSVALSRIWKGPVKFDVVTELPHGFLHCSIASKHAREASQICINRLKEAMSTPSSAK